MRSDKGKAFVMRREGRSYREISERLGVAKGTLSSWFKGVDFSEAIRDELTRQARKKNSTHMQGLNRVRGIALDVQYELAQQEAMKELRQYRNVPLFSTAVALYWCEGDKTSRHQIRITNSDPAVLQVFVAFLDQICGVKKEKMRLALFIYEGLDETVCKRFWARKLGKISFHKTQILPTKPKTKHSQHGMCTIVVGNSYLKKKISVWIDQMPEMVLNTVPHKKQR